MDTTTTRSGRVIRFPTTVSDGEADSWSERTAREIDRELTEFFRDTDLDALE